MIRVVIVLLVLFLIWVLFLSNLSKQQKIMITVNAIILAGLGAWFDGAMRAAKVGLVSPSELHVCGITAQHTYRTNYDIELCLENTNSSGTVNRVGYVVTVEHCNDKAVCLVLAKVERDVLFDLGPQSKGTVAQNLDFKGVDATLTGLTWRAEVVSVKATN